MESLVWGLGLMGEGAGSKPFTDPLHKMTTPAAAIYEELHHEKEKAFHSPQTTEAVERTGKTGPAPRFPLAHILTFSSHLFF